MGKACIGNLFQEFCYQRQQRKGVVAGRICGGNHSSFDTEGMMGVGENSDMEGKEAVATGMSSSRCEAMRSSAKVERLPWMDAVAVYLQ